MEVLLLGAIIVKYDTIVSTFWNLDPFLNIERNSGYFFYNMIIVLKSLYVLYAMLNAIPKLWMLILTFFCKAYLIYMRPDLVYCTYLTVIFHFFDMCVAQMTLMGMLAISCQSFEFILDINVLFCTLYYAGQTYKREIHKLVIIICFSLSIGSYVNNIASAETFRFGVYYLLVVLCLATVFPLLPNLKKYEHRLKFYYMLLIVWIAYKSGLHSTNERLSALQYGSNNVCNITQNIYGSNNDVCNITQNIYERQKCGLNETLESLSLDDILNYGMLRKVDLKVKNLTAVMKDEKKPHANKKEASCKYDLIPDQICSMKVDDSTEESLETEIKGRSDGTIDPEIGRIEATEYDKPSKTDMTVDNGEQENSEAEIKERTDRTINSEVGCIESVEYDKASRTDMKVDNTEQENSEAEIKEKTDGTTNQEIRLIEATENDKVSMTESHKLILSFGDEKNVLEENTNLRQKIFTEDIQHWTDNPFEDEIVSVNLFQMSETNGYAERMDDQSDIAENFQVTETSVDDIDYTIEKRLGNVERIDNGIILHHEIAYKALEFKTSDESENQSHQNDEFVAMIQTLDHNESEDTLTRTKTEIKETKVQATEPYVLSEKDAIIRAVQAEAFMDETTEAKTPETRVLEHAESGVLGESRFHSTHVSQNEENYLPSENGNNTANECTQTAVKPQNPLLKDAETRNLEARETELVSTNLMEEIDAEKVEAILSKAFSNPNQDEIQTKWAISKESDENKVDSSEAEDATEFGSIEYLRTKSKETCKSQIQEHFVETKVSEAREMTEAEYFEPIVSTTKDCAKKFALARYSRASDYEICKPISSANNHEISKDTDSSGSKFEHFKTEKTETINLQTPENADKTGLKYAKKNTDSTDRVVSSNALDSYFPREVGDNELRNTRVNEILTNETPENELIVFVDSETTTLQTTISHQTSDREKHDPGESNLQPYSNEASEIKFKLLHTYESEKTEASEFKDIETKETKEHESGSTKSSNLNAKEIKFSSDSRPRKNTLDSAKKDEADGINTDTIKSQANKIDSVESNETKGSTSEPLLPGNHEIEASGIREGASRQTEASYSGTTKIKGPNVYSSHTIESKQNEYNSNANESKDNSPVGTKELEPTETNYPKEREMEVIKIASPKESQLKFRKSREIDDGFTEASELKITKSNLPSTVQPKPIKGQETSNSIQNEHGYKDNHLRSPTFEETKANYSNKREIKAIKDMGPENSKIHTKYSETRETKDTYTRGTKLGATRSDVLLTKPSKQDYFIESELQFNEVSDPSEKELKVSNVRNFDARDIKSIKLAGFAENQLKHTNTRLPGDSFTGATRLQATKNVPRTTEPKENKEQEVSHLRSEKIEISNALYPSAREIQPIKVMVPEKSSPKSTKVRETKDAYKADKELGDAKTDVSRTFERKPTKQGEVSDSIANEPNKVSRHQKNVPAATTVSYFVSTEIEPIKVTGPKENRFKPTKSDVEINKSGSTIDSEDNQTKSNKVEKLESNIFEMAESSKDNFVDLSEELPILIETNESDYSNKASDSEEIGYKVTKINNFSASEYISITSGYTGSRKVSDVNEIKVTKFKESKVEGELGKQIMKVNPSSNIESTENTFQSNEPTVASIRELKLREVTNHKNKEFDLSEASNVKENKKKLTDENSKLIEPKIEINNLDEDNENEAYKREVDDTNGSEESQAEKETEVINDGKSEIGEILYQKTENAKRAIEHPLTESKKSEISGSYTKTELMSKSDATPIIGSDPKEIEDAKAETVVVDVERPEKILFEGNSLRHRLGSADIVATKIQGIEAVGATEIMPEIPDMYKTAATFQGDQAGQTIQTKSEVQKPLMNFAEAAGPEVVQYAGKDSITTSEIKNDFV